MATNPSSGTVDPRSVPKRQLYEDVSWHHGEYVARSSAGTIFTMLFELWARSYLTPLIATALARREVNRLRMGYDPPCPQSP